MNEKAMQIIPDAIRQRSRPAQMVVKVREGMVSDGECLVTRGMDGGYMEMLRNEFDKAG